MSIGRKDENLMYIYLEPNVKVFECIGITKIDPFRVFLEGDRLRLPVSISLCQEKSIHLQQNKKFLMSGSKRLIGVKTAT